MRIEKTYPATLRYDGETVTVTREDGDVLCVLPADALRRLLCQPK